MTPAQSTNQPTLSHQVPFHQSPSQLQLSQLASQPIPDGSQTAPMPPTSINISLIQQLRTAQEQSFHHQQRQHEILFQQQQHALEFAFQQTQHANELAFQHQQQNFVSLELDHILGMLEHSAQHHKW